VVSLNLKLLLLVQGSLLIIVLTDYFLLLNFLLLISYWNLLTAY